MIPFLAKTNRFHLLVAVCWQFSMFFATQMIFSIFSSYIPRWRCSDSQSASFGRNCTEFNFCPAPNHIQFEDNHFQSAALEFNWVCGPKAYLVALYAQLQFFGVLVGTLLFGSLSDYFGRKPIAIFVLAAGISMMVLSGLAPTVKGIARLFLTVVCYYFPYWRHASFMSAIGTLPALLLVIFALPESPTWLHSKDKLQQMRESERKIARIANLKYEEIQHEPIMEKQPLLQLLKDNTLLKRILVLWIMWFVASLSSYTNDLNSNSIVGNLFLNQLLFAIFLMLIPFDLFNFSRRNLHQYSQLVVIVCFLTLTVFVLNNEHGTPLLIVNLFGCAFIEYTWDACYLCAIESMPTNMRATSLGSCSLIARIGAVLAPTLAFMNTIWAPSAYLAVAVLGTISFLVSYFWLIETRGINLDSVKLHEEHLEVDKGKIQNGNAEEQTKMLQ
uniref:Major facilitator superfamily (MFS) profile domain-containing protein n=1 Tax=Ditylenchus dipsaci TaxID=166011 RepID=A0A915ETS8_9BILA